MTPSIKVSKRDVLKTLAALSTAVVCPPLIVSTTASANIRKTRILWSSISIMRPCTDYETEKNVEVEQCRQVLEKYFPNTTKILNDMKIASQIQYQYTQIFQNFNKESRDLDIVWYGQPGQDQKEIPDVDYGMFLGITDERQVVASKNDKAQTTFATELQTYLVIFDMNKFEVKECFPIRSKFYLTYPTAGLGPNLYQKIFSNFLTGRDKDIGRGIPPLLTQKIKDIASQKNSLARKTISVRVTDVKLKDFALSQLKRFDIPPALFKQITGEYLSNAFAEGTGYGIQPFNPDNSLRDLTTTFSSNVANQDATLFDKLFNMAPIGLDLRLVCRGWKMTKTPSPVDPYRFRIRFVVNAEIEASIWDRKLNDPNDPSQGYASEDLVEVIFKQSLRSILVEEATGTWINEWYWVLDLHQRLFLWFFSNIIDTKNLPNMVSGRTKSNPNNPSRQFLEKIVTEDFKSLKHQTQSLILHLKRYD